jgi:hypothetical protein
LILFPFRLRQTALVPSVHHIGVARVPRNRRGFDSPDLAERSINLAHIFRLDRFEGLTLATVQMTDDNQEYSHEDFVVVRTDERYGGFEELRHKDETFSVRRSLFWRLSHSFFHSIPVSSANVSLLATLNNLTICMIFLPVAP